ncbi:hypothetical protein TNIN_306181 [Trichonephila inaurata madagascariensis]|uniref:DUF5641 domain-containing protein n=1 Tax=Trichonephila inaurata madagascariensis TaxID=2747483 RepID=A0A8X6XDA6_9ARAC|nr:hypothetical protein TNIN_306181 [Trichonephila inaurata madagascariensis]
MLNRTGRRQIVKPLRMWFQLPWQRESRRPYIAWESDSTLIETPFGLVGLRVFKRAATPHEVDRCERKFEGRTTSLLKTQSQIPMKWTLARVIKIHPGEDGLVRVVDVKTAKGTFTEPSRTYRCLEMLTIAQRGRSIEAKDEL